MMEPSNFIESINQTFLNNIHVDPSSKLSILVSVSGGPDSVALFHWARLSNFFSKQLSLAHVNYHLRGEDSERDEEFVRELAATYQVPIFVKSVHLERSTDIQNQARIARFDFYKETTLLNHMDFVLLGHHQDDSIETFLYRLFRGAGFKGLSSIEYYKEMGSITVIRPFLGVTKADILRWLESNRWEWRHDRSNEQSLYKRNYIRNTVLPTIEQGFPSARRKIDQVISLMHLNHLYYEYKCELIFYRHIKWYQPDSFLFLFRFIRHLPQIVFSEWLAYTWAKLTKHSDGLTYAEIEKAYFMIEEDPLTENPILIEHQHYVLAKEYHYLSLYQKNESTPEPISLETNKTVAFGKWELHTIKSYPELYKDYDTKDWIELNKCGSILLGLEKEVPITVSICQDGDTFEFQPGQHKKLSDFFIDAKIPKRLRQQTLCVRACDKIAAIVVPKPYPTIRVSPTFYYTLKTRQEYLALIQIKKLR